MHKWYFVTKIVLTYCEKKKFQWSRKSFERYAQFQGVILKLNTRAFFWGIFCFSTSSISIMNIKLNIFPDFAYPSLICTDEFELRFSELYQAELKKIRAEQERSQVKPNWKFSSYYSSQLDLNTWLTELITNMYTDASISLPQACFMK